MREPASIHDERDRRLGAEDESQPEGASCCTEIGSEDSEMKWPIAEMVGTAVFVVAICLGTAALISWIV